MIGEKLLSEVVFSDDEGKLRCIRLRARKTLFPAGYGAIQFGSNMRSRPTVGHEKRLARNRELRMLV